MAALGMITVAKGNMNYWDMATCFACCEFGSLLPDIDTTSKITEEDIAFKAVSLGLRGAGVKHRGITHTLWASALFGALFFLIATVMVRMMNSSVSFLLACIVFLMIHADNGAYEIKKFGSIIAVGVYLGLPIAMQFLPKDILSTIPTIEVKISPLMVGLSVFWGCISHLLYDTCNKEGIGYLLPFVKKRISILPITTSSMAETIFATVMSIITTAWFILLLYLDYFKLPI